MSRNLITKEKRTFMNNYFDLLLESKSYDIMDKAIVRIEFVFLKSSLFLGKFV